MRLPLTQLKFEKSNLAIPLFSKLRGNKKQHTSIFDSMMATQLIYLAFEREFVRTGI